MKKQEKLKALKDKIISEQPVMEELSTLESSNNIILKKFVKQYNEALTLVITSENPNKINLIQLNNLFDSLGLTTIPDSPREIIHTNPNSNLAGSNKKEIINLTESVIKQQEKKLICLLWENLKDEEGLVNTDQLFLFVLSQLNLYEFYMYSTFKKHHINKKFITETVKENDELTKITEVFLTTETVTEENNTSNNVNMKLNKSRPLITHTKVTKEDKPLKHLSEKESVLNSISQELNSKVKLAKKYCCLDEMNSFLLTFANAKSINKDFRLFYVNWSNNLYNSAKSLHTDEVNKNKNSQSTFKPKINEKSSKLSSEFRRKIQNGKVVF